MGQLGRWKRVRLVGEDLSVHQVGEVNRHTLIRARM